MNQMAIGIGIGANLTGGFSSTFQTANTAVTSLSNSINKINATMSKIDNLQKMQDRLSKLNGTISADEAKLKSLRSEIEKNGGSNKKLEREYQKIESRIQSTKSKRDNEIESIRKSSNELQKQGIDINNTAKEYEKLSKQVERYKRAESIKNMGQSIQNKGRAMSSAGNDLIRTGTVMSAPIVASVKYAIDEEKNWAQVKKLANFKNAEEEKMFKADLQRMITEKGMAMDLQTLYEGAASGFQAGLSKEENLQYIEAGAKMSYSFDISGSEGAQYLYTLRNEFQKSLPEVMDLADQINALAKTSGASETQIADYVIELGRTATVAGFSTKQTAALGSTLIEMGMAPEVAANASKKLFNVLANGTDALSKSQSDMLKAVGVDANQLAKMAQKDSGAAMDMLFGSLSKVDPEKAAGIFTELFGERGKVAAANIAKGQESYKKHREMVENPENYRGESESQYQALKDTAKQQLVNLKGQFEIVAAQLGTALLPTLKELATSVGDIMQKISVFVKNNPEKVKNYATLFAKVTAAVVGLGLALKVVGTAVQGVGVAMKIVGFITSTNPIGLIVAAIAGLIYIGYKVCKNWDLIKAKAKEVWGGIKNKIAELLPKIGEFVDKWWPLLGPFGGILKLGRLVYQNWDLLKQKAGEIKDWAVEKFTAIKDTLASIPEAAINAFQTAADFIFEKIQAIIDKIKGIKDAISNALSGGEQQYEKKQQYDLNSQSAYVGYAKGGIVNRPTYAMIGEGGDSEAVIPLNNSQRSKDLYAAAGKYIHSENMPDLYQTATKFMSNTANGKGDSSKEAIVYNDNRVINCKDAAGVKEVLDQDKQMTINQFKKMLDQVNSEKIRRGYGR